MRCCESLAFGRGALLSNPVWPRAGQCPRTRGSATGWSASSAPRGRVRFWVGSGGFTTGYLPAVPPGREAPVALVRRSPPGLDWGADAPSRVPGRRLAAGLPPRLRSSKSRMRRGRREEVPARAPEPARGARALPVSASNSASTLMPRRAASPHQCLTAGGSFRSDRWCGCTSAGWPCGR
jgi:hypothetical protein